jgi:hypothetical protein
MGASARMRASPIPPAAMTDGPSPRTALLLMTWTVGLLGLVLVHIHDLPFGLAVLLVPYLALMVRHWSGGLRRRTIETRPRPHEDPGGFGCADGAGQDANHSGPVACTGETDAPTPGPGVNSTAEEYPMPTPVRRSRSRRRADSPEPVQPDSTWVRVQPGRYIRAVQPVSQDRHVDESDTSPSRDPESAREEAGGPPAEAEVEGGCEAAQDTSGPDDPGTDRADPEDRPAPP